MCANRPHAVVVAAGVDWQTTFFAAAAAETVALLQGLYNTQELRDGQATRTNLQGLLAGLTLPVGLGSFFTHGCSGGLLERLGGGLLLDPPMCGALGDAILLLQACLYDGAFPAAIASPPGGVAAVIGYAEVLHVLHRFWLSSAAPAAVAEFRTACCQAVLQPLRALLAGCTVAEAEEQTRQGWEQLAWDARWPRLFAPGEVELIQAVFLFNAENVGCWGDANARLLP